MVRSFSIDEPLKRTESFQYACAHYHPLPTPVLGTTRIVSELQSTDSFQFHHMYNRVSNLAIVNKMLKFTVQGVVSIRRREVNTQIQNRFCNSH